MYEDLFDKIKVDGKEIKGVIDYVTKKHIMFYDFTNTESCSITLLVILWKTTDPTERFSVFAAKNFPLVNIGKVSMINKKHVSGHLKGAKESKPSIEKNRMKLSESK